VSSYTSIAHRVVVAAYSLNSLVALTVPELLDLGGMEADAEQVLVDDDARRLSKLDRLTDALRDELLECERRRIAPPIAESDLAPGSFLPAFADDDGLEDDVRYRRARLRLTRIMRAALQQVSPDDFERVCGLLMRSIGCSGVTVTQSQKDDGVDFIAALSIAAGYRLSGDEIPLFHRVMGAISFVVFGQAKRYSDENKVTQESVVELQGNWQALSNELINGNIDSAREEALARADFRSSPLTATRLHRCCLRLNIGVERLGPGTCNASPDSIRTSLNS
jgi:hypothetical protein